MNCFLLFFRTALCYIMLSALLTGMGARAQSVGTGTTTPDNTAILDLVTPAGVDADFDKGLLIPRMNDAQRQMIINPVKGLPVFQTDDDRPGFCYNAGTRNSCAWTYPNPTSGSDDNLGNHDASYQASPTAETLTNAGPIGCYAQVSQSNSLVLGGTGSSAVSVSIDTTAPGYTLDVNGPIRCASAVNTSNARLEQNIWPIEPVLTNVLHLRRVRYSSRHNEFAALDLPAGEQVDVLAQDLEKIYSGLISTDAHRYKAIDYAQLTPVLLEALKEQQRQIETLQKQAVVLSQRAADSEAATLRRVARAEAATVALEKRLQNLEAAGMHADAQR